jgi:predicted ArsR family transcriptional regulator
MLQHAREIAPSVSWEILAHVKRTGGISVNELTVLLKMSYMGVKQHCDDLKKRGYVDTWRRPKPTGRPEKIFRPTPKLDLVLPNWGNELCLGVLSLLSQVHGENAPERLLYSFLQQKGERWSSKLKSKSLRERAMEFTKVRIAEGWMCELSEDENAFRIVEQHSPLAEVARLYPNLWDMEAKVLEKLFSTSVKRDTTGGRNELVLQKPLPPPGAVGEAILREDLFD